MAKRIFISITVLLCLLSGSIVQADRDYGFPSLVIEAEVQRDGTVRFLEERTVSFEGHYTGLFQWINLDRGMKITDVTVGEAGSSYEYNPEHNIGPKGTYFAEQRGSQFYIDWSFEAVDETRTFQVGYTVHNAVLVHDDVAEFYYQFVGDEWEKGVDQVDVILHLPQGAGKEDVRAWGHGPLNGIVEIVDGQTVRWRVSPLRSKTMVEGRVAFPTNLVPGATNRTGRAGLPGILEEEEAWAAETNRRRQLARVDIVLGMVLGLVSILGSITLWMKYGKAHPTDFDGEYYRELPAQYSPAELGILWNSGLTSTKDLSATLLDLARRKVLRISEEMEEKKGLLKTKSEMEYAFTLLEKPSSLKPHEKDLIDFLFNEVADEGQETVSLSDLEKFARKHKRTFAEFWKGWQETVKLTAEKHVFFESPSTLRAVVIISGILGIFLSIPAFITNWLFSGTGLIVASSFLVITGALMRRRTPRANNEYVRWKAFRKFLLHFSEMPRHDVPSLIIWEHYLVYAVTLGVADKVIKQLEIVFPNLEDGQYRFGYGWYYYHMHPGRSLNQGLSNFTSSLDRSFAQSIQAATGQSSSGSGAGGGFSGGGGGGFGGGGGGAR